MIAQLVSAELESAAEVRFSTAHQEMLPSLMSSQIDVRRHMPRRSTTNRRLAKSTGSPSPRHPQQLLDSVEFHRLDAVASICPRCLAAADR